MKKIFYILICFMFIYFIKYPTKAFLASQSGILLWFEQILPVLLPFSILSNILLALSEQKSTQRTYSFLRINSWEWFTIICGIFFGFPIGSKLTADIYQKGYTSKTRASILCSFTNNMSPAFVSSFVCNNILGSNEKTFYIFFSLYAIPFILGCIRLARQPQVNLTQKNTASRFQLDMQIIDAGIISSFITLMKLCGYIVMFSITADLLLQVHVIPVTVKALLIGLTEVTNGIAQLSLLPIPVNTKAIIAVALLSFGGLCGIAQTNSMISPCGLSIQQYIKNKVFYTVCSVFVCSLFFFIP